MKNLHLPATLSLALILPIGLHADEKPFDEPWLGSRLEQQTPAGSVPALTAAPLAPALPDEQHYLAQPGSGVDQTLLMETLKRFRAAYQQGGEPRMAVYFNRELSDEVREWVPGSHHSISSSHEQSATFNSLQTGRVSAQGSASATMQTQSRHYTGDTGKRQDMRESWHWQFEDAITATLLEGGANIVDRAVIFRQMAHAQPQTAGMDGSMSSLRNETSALNSYADVLIEMKVTRSDTALGYDFRASARDVQSGRILATAFVNGNQGRQHNVDVAAASGYALRQDNYLTLEQVSQELTLKLMQSLSRHWGA